jgi:hypothetical protein
MENSKNEEERKRYEEEYNDYYMEEIRSQVEMDKRTGNYSSPESASDSEYNENDNDK